MEMKWEKGDVESSPHVHSHNLFTHIHTHLHKQRLAPYPHPVHTAYVNCVKIIWACPQQEEKSQCPISSVEAALAASHHVPLTSKALKIYPNKTVSILEINPTAKAKRADMVYISLAVKRTSSDNLEAFFSSRLAHTHIHLSLCFLASLRSQRIKHRPQGSSDLRAAGSVSRRDNTTFPTLPPVSRKWSRLSSSRWSLRGLMESGDTRK